MEVELKHECAGFILSLCGPLQGLESNLIKQKNFEIYFILELIM